MATQCDVIIVGAGFFGCCTALLLAQQGYSVTIVSEKKQPLYSFINSLQTLWPSLNDPPTRADVAHGREVACYLNDFCSQGINFFLTDILPYFENSRNWISSPSLRVSLQPFEQEELLKAKELGFGLKQSSKDNIFIDNNKSYICKNPLIFQDEIINILKLNHINLKFEKVISLKEEQSKCLIELNSESLESEIVVLAHGKHISSLFPKFESILVPMSDILLEYECISQKQIAPITFRAANGHLAGSLFNQGDKTILRITGPRFLLPQAGVGIFLNKETITENTLKNIKKFHHQIFLFLSSYYKYKTLDEFLNEFPFEHKKYSVGIDYHPCDELPLLGEFGKLGRILGNTGWLATGFSSGVWASKIIFDLICFQKSDFLLPRLQPRRFYKIL